MTQFNFQKFKKKLVGDREIVIEGVDKNKDAIDYASKELNISRT